MIVTLNPLEIPNFSCYFHTPYSKTILYSRIAVNFARTLSFFLQIVSSASFSVWAALISSSLAAIPSFAWVLTALSPSIAVLKAFKTLSTFFDRFVDYISKVLFAVLIILFDILEVHHIGQNIQFWIEMHY